SSRGQPQLTLADPLKQVAIKFLFESFDLLAECRLSAECGITSLGKAAELGYLIETYDLLPLH
ncbi:MAG: hypothetical protein P8X67_02805, partial [Syntrophobacterales bacterium]